MRFTKRLLLCLGLTVLLSISALASDCETITAEWFGSHGTDGSMLELETVETDGEIAAVLGAYAQEREDQFTEEITAYTRELDRSQQIALLEERIHAIITDAKVTMLVTAVEETGEGCLATVYEWTFFDYDDLADGIGGSDTAGFGTEHKMLFRYDEAGKLQLVSDEYTESDVLTGEIPIESAEGEAEILGMPLVTDPKYVETYDPIKAILYADTWVTHEDLDGDEDPSYYNPAYKAYHNIGGDCSNYVSQCLHAGGMPLSGSWVPDNYVWINCQGQHFHFWNQGKTIPNPEPEDIYPGSPIYYWGYTHVTLCVGYNSAGTPVINGHTSDRYRVPWNYSKETVAYTLQLTEYRLEPAEFREDYLFVRQDSKVPLHGFFRNETADAELEIKAGELLDVRAVFTYEDAQWAATHYEDTVYYIKLDENLCLSSQGLEISLSGDTITTNDYLTVTVSIPEDVVTEAKMTIGASGALEMDVEDGKATLTLDCRNFSSGEKNVKITAQGEKTGQWLGIRKIQVEDAPVASGEGWTLDKNTGHLTILSDVAEAQWRRFGDKVKTVEVSAAVTALPEEPFLNCGVKTIYGPQEFLEPLAAALKAEWVYDAFLDVTPLDWYFADANAAAKAGAFQGTSATEFSGTVTMTRSMFVTVLARISGEDLAQYEDTPFTDVEENTWYSDGLKWGYATGIVKGTSDTTFSPSMEVTREQALTMIGRFVGYYGLELPDAENPAKPFADGEAIADWAKADVETMRMKGIAQGTPTGEFQPGRSMTRAEAATFVMRLVRSIGDQELMRPDGEATPDTENLPTLE